MARSRRRTISRQSNSTSRFPYVTWAKWALVALGVTGGTYGVFKVVNTTPTGAVAVSEGTEVGPHLAEAASTQKPPLPDDSSPGFGGAASLSPMRMASHTNPADAETAAAALTSLPPRFGGNGMGTGNSSDLSQPEPRPTGPNIPTLSSQAGESFDRNLSNSLSEAAASGNTSGPSTSQSGENPATSNPMPSIPALGGSGGSMPKMPSDSNPVVSNNSGTTENNSNPTNGPRLPGALPSIGSTGNPADSPNPVASNAGSEPSNPMRTPGQPPGRLPDAGLPTSPAIAAASGSEEEDNPATPITAPRPRNPDANPLVSNGLRENNSSTNPSNSALANNPNVPRLNSNPSSSDTRPPMSNPERGPALIDSATNPATNPSLPRETTPPGSSLRTDQGMAESSQPGGSFGSRPLGAPTTPSSLPATSPTIGIPSENRVASLGPTPNPGIRTPTGQPPITSPGPPPRSESGTGLPQANPMASDPRRTPISPSTYPNNNGAGGREETNMAGGTSINPSSRMASSLVSNRPGDPQWEIQQQAALVIEKLAPPSVQVNVPAKFLMVVRNVGRVPAGQVFIRDRVPEKARLLQATPKPTRQDGDVMEWELAALAPGEAFQIQLELLPTEPGEIGSVAQVTSTAVAANRTRSTRPQLSIEHSAPQQVMVGQNVVLNIVIRNEGDGIAENVVIREVVPPQLMHPSGNEIENPLGPLAPGQTRTLQLPLVARSPGVARNTIRVSGDGKLSAEHSIDIQVVAPQLQVSGDGPDRRFLSRPATHTFQVKNLGSANATNVQMMARLPQGLKYEDSSPAGRYDPSRHAVFWAMQHLPSNAEQQVSVTTMPMAPGQQPIEFHALADLNQPQVTTKTMIVEQLSELFFDIDDLQDPIEVGTNTTYVIRVENQGSKVANNVAVVVDMPAGIEPLTVEAPIEYQLQRDGQKSRLVFAPLPSMNPRAQMVIRVEARGSQEGDHRIEVNMTSAQRPTPVAKQESTKVYADR